MTLTVRQRVKAITRGEPMSDTKEHIMFMLMQDGATPLAEALGVASKTIHEKLKGNEGFKIDQLAIIFDLLGISLIDNKTQVPVDIDDYQSLVKNNRKFMELIEKNIEKTEKRNHLKPVS